MVAGAGAIVRKEKKTVAAFREVGATARDRAVDVATLGIRQGLAFRILRRHSIVREAGEGRYYLDEPAWEAHQARRRRIAVVLVVALVFVGIAFSFWTLHR